MSIQNRIRKAEKDFVNGDLENALIQALIAVAATSKKRYPKEKDGVAFKKFLENEFMKNIQPNISIVGGPLKVEYNGQLTNIEDILYKYVRCNLLHEAELPPELLFAGPNTGFHISFDQGKLILGWGTVETLIRIVVEAPENKALFHSS